MSTVGIRDFDPTPHLAPRQVPPQLAMAAKVMTAVGALSLLGGLFVGDRTITGIAVLVNTIYFTAICFGAIAFCAAMTITLARWSRPLKRIAESFISFTPVLWVILLVFFLAGGLNFYEWHTNPEVIHGHKAVWLTAPFFVGRLLLGLGLLSALGVSYVLASVRADAALANKSLGGHVPEIWHRFFGELGEPAAELEASQQRMIKLAPAMGIFFALVMSFFAFDVMMSLAPHWYSNMFGGWFFMSCFWVAMITIGWVSLTFRKWLGIEKYLKPSVYHDLGKLIFGFTMFWAYTFYAQLLAIWYGNMTEEIGFLLVRMTLEPWTYISRIVGVTCFLIPWVTLLSRGIKKMPTGLGIVLLILSVGIWFERFIVVAPSIWKQDTLPLDVFSVGITVGYFGAFIWWVSAFLSRVPAMPVSDPYMLPNPMDVHVHSHDAHAHH